MLTPNWGRLVRVLPAATGAKRVDQSRSQRSPWRRSTRRQRLVAVALNNTLFLPARLKRLGRFGVVATRTFR
jgi:hypothetical protein